MRQFAYVLTLASMVILFRWIKIPRDQIYLFDVAHEVNFWTWMNVAYMLFAAQVIWLSTWLRRVLHLPWVGWALAGLALALLSLDDFISIRECLEPLGESLGGGSGLLQFAWVIPGFVAAVLVITVFVSAMRSAAPAVRRDFALGAAFFFGGVLGMEMISGAVLSEFGHRRPYTLLYQIEELFEAVGMTLIARAGLKDVIRMICRSSAQT